MSKLCVKCVREELAAVRELVMEVERRTDDIEEMLGQLIDQHVESTVGQ